MCPALNQTLAVGGNLANDKFTPIDNRYMSHIQSCLISNGVKTGLIASLIAARTDEATTCRIRIRCYPTSTKNESWRSVGFLVNRTDRTNISLII